MRSHPFEKVANEFAVKMRSKVHKQSYSNAVMRQQARRLSPTARLAVERVAELVVLQQRHQRTLDPALRTEATQILRTLPLLSTDEDPRFVHTHRALRVAAYFGAVDLPTTYALINQHTKNAFLLDAVAISSFFFTLAKLQHPQTADIITILLPRLRELAPELLPHEAAHVLRLLHQTGMEDAKLVNAFTDTIVNTVADIPLTDVRQCIIALAERYPDNANRVLAAATQRLRDEIEFNGDAKEVKAAIMDVCRVVSLTCSGPRDLLNSVGRRSPDLIQHLTSLDVAYILKAFHMSSYRHLRALRVLSSSLATRVATTTTTTAAASTAGARGELSPMAVSMAVQALAHFYVTGCEEVVLTLVSAVADALEGLNLALTLVSCVKLQCVSPAIKQATDVLCGAPLRRYTQRAHSLQVTSRLLYAMSQAGRCNSTEDVANLRALLSSVLRTRGPIPDDSRNFLLDTVTTLVADSRCSDDGVKRSVQRVQELLLSSHSGGTTPS